MPFRNCIPAGAGVSAETFTITFAGDALTSQHQIQARYLRSAGHVVSFEHRIAVQSNSNVAQVCFATPDTVPYDVGSAHRSGGESGLEFPTGTARTAEEIVIDELARRMDRDPLKFRAVMIKHERGRAVLATVAEAGSWGQPLGRGRAQAIGYHAAGRSHVACLAELDVRDRKPRVDRAVIAIDVGQADHARGVEAQTLAGTMLAVAAALPAGVRPPAEFEVHPRQSTGVRPGTAGALVVPAVAGALANAYARATGSRPRTFPISC